MSKRIRKVKREGVEKAVETLEVKKVWDKVLWCKPTENQLFWHRVKVDRVYILGDRAFAICPIHNCELEVILKKAIQK